MLFCLFMFGSELFRVMLQKSSLCLFFCCVFLVVTSDLFLPDVESFCVSVCVSTFGTMVHIYYARVVNGFGANAPKDC